MGPRLLALGSALAIAGVLLLGHAAVTVLWREPVSALVASAETPGLERDLAVLEREARIRAVREARGSRAGMRAAGALARRVRQRARPGAPLGRIELPRGAGRHVLVEGTTAGALRRGPGRYEETALPGEGRTVAFAGHRTTWTAPFRYVDRLRSGDRIDVRMPYGRFAYEVEDVRTVDATAVEVLRERGGERLVLTACDPPFSATGRIVVSARLVRTAGFAGS